MRPAFVEAPSAHLPVPLLLSSVNEVTKSSFPQYVYVKVTLSSPLMDFETEHRLEARGLECISAGETHIVYGIVPNERTSIDRLLKDPEVLSVEISEPATGK